jgi:putative oxidoreductase
MLQPWWLTMADSHVSVASNIKHRTSNIPQFVWRIVDVIVGGVFIYAGVIKALDPIRFANDIDNYKVLPWAISVRLAFYLPWLEIFCGIALIARRLYFGGLSILTALVSIFVVATLAAKIRGLDISCGCFGHVSKNWSLPAHLAFDFVLLIFLLLLSGRALGEGGANSPRNVDV